MSAPDDGLETVSMCDRLRAKCMGMAPPLLLTLTTLGSIILGGLAVADIASKHTIHIKAWMNVAIIHAACYGIASLYSVYYLWKHQLHVPVDSGLLKKTEQVVKPSGKSGDSVTASQRAADSVMQSFVQTDPTNRIRVALYAVAFCSTFVVAAFATALGIMVNLQVEKNLNDGYRDQFDVNLDSKTLLNAKALIDAPTLVKLAFLQLELVATAVSVFAALPVFLFYMITTSKV